MGVEAGGRPVRDAGSFSKLARETEQGLSKLARETEQGLSKRARETEQTFDEFYRGTRTRVLEYLYAAGGDLAEAQDAAQEAYTRAWQRWAQVSACADPEAW